MRLRGSAGFTLLELIIAGTIAGVALMIIAVLMIHSLQALQGEGQAADVDTLIAMETMSRSISSAQEFVQDAGINQISLRVDPNSPGTLTALDDSWVSYRLLVDAGGNGALRWATRAVRPVPGVPAVTAVDPEVVAGLNVLPVLSWVTLVNPTGAGTASVVNLRLTSREGPNEAPRSFEANVALRSAK